MNDKIILICAVARSGSTTLELLLNTIPNSNICGENNGAVNHLLEFYREIKVTQTMVQNEFKDFNNEDKKNLSKLFEQGKKPAWFNTFEFEQVKKSIQNMIITMFKKNTTINVWGFKEIRYYGKLELLKEFRELFPQTKVIMNIRQNQNKQSKSGWFKNDPASLQKIQKETRDIIEFYKVNQDFCFLNTLERMYNKQHMISLFKFIDCEKHFNEEKIKKILMNTRET
jgi:hypothetical protein